MAATVKPSTRWVLPVPGGPRSRMPECSLTKRAVARSRIRALGTCGLKDQSKVSPFTSGIPAAFRRLARSRSRVRDGLVGALAGRFVLGAMVLFGGERSWSCS